MRSSTSSPTPAAQHVSSPTFTHPVRKSTLLAQVVRRDARREKPSRLTPNECPHGRRCDAATPPRWLNPVGQLAVALNRKVSDHPGRRAVLFDHRDGVIRVRSRALIMRSNAARSPGPGTLTETIATENDRARAAPRAGSPERTLAVRFAAICKRRLSLAWRSSHRRRRPLAAQMDDDERSRVTRPGCCSAARRGKPRRVATTVRASGLGLPMETSESSD